MSDATHSPGPWRWVLGRGSKHDLPGIDDADGNTVCHFGNDTTYYPSEGEPPGPADRDLMLAAPELLAALVALTTNPHQNLGDLVYDVRDREGLGWEGPSVVAWSKAVVAAEAAIARAIGGGE